MNNDTMRIHNYICYNSPIGKGSFSKVYKAYNIMTKENVAIKKIGKQSLQKLSMDRVKQEMDLVKNLNHKNIVKTHEMFVDNNNVYIVSEYCNGGTLKKLIEKHYPFLEMDVKYYVTQIKDALIYLISKNIYHRDIKPQNILINYKNKNKNNINDIELKIADFGFAKELKKDNLLDTLCGTPMYIAPELYTKKQYHINSDLWSVGIIMFQMMYNFFPFGKPKNILELLKNIENFVLKLPETNNSGLSESLILNLLQQNPEDRLSWDEFFNHSWFNTDEYDISENEENELENSITKILKEKLVIKSQEIPINKVNNIKIIDNYYSFSLPTTNSTIKKLDIPKSNSFSYNTVPKFTDSVYNFISTSIDNLRKFTLQ